jgi:hypothetical protein
MARHDGSGMQNGSTDKVDSLFFWPFAFIQALVAVSSDQDRSFYIDLKPRENAWLSVFEHVPTVFNMNIRVLCA